MVKHWIVYIFTCIIVFALLLFFADYFFMVVLFLMVVFPVFSYLMAKKVVNSTLMLISYANQQIQYDTDMLVEFQIKNNCQIPLSAVKLKVYVGNLFYPNEERHEFTFPLRSGNETYQWKIHGSYAGMVQISVLECNVMDYLGLFRFSIPVKVLEQCLVIPKTEPMIMEIIKNKVIHDEEEESQEHAFSEDVTELKEVRQYRPGDRLQKVHWKVSARQEELFVKEYEKEQEELVVLYLNLQKSGDDNKIIDDLITVFYSAALQLLFEGFLFEAMWWDDNQKKMQRIVIESEEGLRECLNQIYLMRVITRTDPLIGLQTHDIYGQVLCVTECNLSNYDEDLVLTTYNDRVMVVCL